MCALCGALLSDHWAEADGGRRARVFRVRLLDRILGHFGLGVRDAGGRAYVLYDRKGRAKVVSDLGALWQEAERLAGGRLDPLDPALVAALAPDG